MTAKLLLASLLLLFTLLPGILARGPREIHVKAGEMVALQCPHYGRSNSNESTLVWTSHTAQRTYVTSNMSLTELKQMGVLIHQSRLVILSVSINHQGNYSCSVRNASSQFWFMVTVNAAQSSSSEKMAKYSETCHEQQPCKLKCPDVNIPAAKTPYLTFNDITWHKKGESLAMDGYFPRVEDKDHGNYICTRSYRYHGQIYNMTFSVILDVQPTESERSASIISPRENDVFYVEMGSTVVIDCEAVTYSDFDSVFWLRGKSFVDRNAKLPVFYKYKWENNGDKIKMTASLVFRKVSPKDLKRKYTCKLQSVDQPSSFVTIRLAQRCL